MEPETNESDGTSESAAGAAARRLAEIVAIEDGDERAEAANAFMIDMNVLAAIGILAQDLFLGELPTQARRVVTKAFERETSRRLEAVLTSAGFDTEDEKPDGWPGWKEPPAGTEWWASRSPGHSDAFAHIFGSTAEPSRCGRTAIHGSMDPWVKLTAKLAERGGVTYCEECLEHARS